jgi:D-glycero-D-manno-heptose 1,7-bisphosphate phosphatase
VINRAIVRDGRPYPPTSLSELEVLRGVPEALGMLHEAGYMLIVVTNQPDVARGTMSKGVVESINGHLAALLPIDEFRTCYHDNNDGCGCRKPLPGALLDAAREYGIDIKGSYMVGDRWRDIEAGHRAGCKTIFIDYGYAERQPENADHYASTLAEAARIVMGEMQ